VLDEAIAAAKKASGYDPEILKLGRDLYYAKRDAVPADALERARIALAAALEIQS
jgi:hypothetical protein